MANKKNYIVIPEEMEQILNLTEKLRSVGIDFRETDFVDDAIDHFNVFPWHKDQDERSLDGFIIETDLTVSQFDKIVRVMSERDFCGCDKGTQIRLIQAIMTDN